MRVYRPRAAACAAAASVALALTPAAARAQWETLQGVYDQIEVRATVGFEGRAFPESPAFAGQFEHVQPSVFAELEITWESEDRDTQLQFVPFFRLDGQDEERTHFDVREAYLRRIWDDWELLIGANRVFWGVTESRHLVNIVNQIDAVEDIDEEDFLGQPMVNLARQTDVGRVDVFFFPVFRERTFPGIDGRLRGPVAVDTERARFASGLEEFRPSFALRYSHFIGDVDIGAHVFHGTSREPDLLVAADGSLVPRYPVITQGGLDLQLTRGPYLWKFEGLVRAGQGDLFAAAVGGLEYTFFQVFDSDADLGLLVEGLYDGRDETLPLSAAERAEGFLSAAPFGTVLEQDVFLGTRLALNDVQDTSFLAGLFLDVEDGPASFRIEAERRLGDSWRAELEATVFLETDDRNPSSVFADDSFVTLRLSRFF
ncbi:MAG: hypothetical protein AAF677_03095 [Pseudomonadota bacterium]